MVTLICGSFAYDTIMVFPDKFKHHILPDKVHILNVSFNVSKMRREFGGCAGNIAYNLRLLEGEPLPMGTVGDDFGPYAEWMDRCGIARTHVTPVPGTYTAQAFITTDMDDNQITAFHVGAMIESHRNSVKNARDVKLGIVSPDGGDGMIQHAKEFADAGIPFIFDPGQAMPLFDGKQLLQFLEEASFLSVNDYEAQMFTDKTGKTLKELAARVKALVVTKGAQGSEIHIHGRVVTIPAAKAKTISDPTGCGDAYRAGLLFGIARGMEWETTGRIAALMGAIKIEHHGTQNHRFTLAEFAARFKQEFGFSF